MRLIIVIFKVEMSHLLIVNNDSDSRALLTALLKKSGHQLTYFHESDALLTYLQNQSADLIVLDNFLPEEALLALTTKLHESFAIPILLLGEQVNTLDGLKAGADQYLIKPFCPNALLVHINVLLRRVTLEKQRLAFQHCNGQLSFQISRLSLTDTETQLIQYLSKNDGDIISKATLQKEVLKKELSAFDRNLDVHISNIRRKMLKAGLSKMHIKTIHGKGYSFFQNV
jgi:DNA-binding response OmpR family regulator